MLDRLFDILIAIWDHLCPVNIVNKFDKGVHLRFGRFLRVLEPGLKWKLPFCDTFIIHWAEDDTISLPSQKLTTKDGKTVSVRGTILYHIDDIQKFALDVNDAQQAICDVAMGLIAENIIQSNYEETVSTQIMNEISKQVRRDCKKWGVYIEYVKIIDLSLSRSFNIFKEGESHL